MKLDSLYKTHTHNLHKKFILLTLLLSLVSVNKLSFAQNTEVLVEVINLQHRTAEDITAQVKALYPEQQVHIAGHRQQLTIRANGVVIDEIKQLVATLDLPLRQFSIRISNDQNVNSSNQHTYQTRRAGNQSITVLEGHSAYVNSGQKKPVQTRQFINGQWANTIEYIDMTSGVYIEPRLVGNNRVELKIRSQKNEASKLHLREIDTSTIDTVRIIGLGEWVNIGGSYYGDNNDGMSYSTKQRNVDKQSVMINVDLLPE
jgi:hypothetical protein